MARQGRWLVPALGMVLALSSGVIGDVEYPFVTYTDCGHERAAPSSYARTHLRAGTCFNTRGSNSGIYYCDPEGTPFVRILNGKGCKNEKAVYPLAGNCHAGQQITCARNPSAAAATVLLQQVANCTASPVAHLFLPAGCQPSPYSSGYVKVERCDLAGFAVRQYSDPACTSYLAEHVGVPGDCINMEETAFITARGFASFTFGCGVVEFNAAAPAPSPMLSQLVLVLFGLAWSGLIGHLRCD